MLFKGKTHEEWMAENRIRVEKWERDDAPAIAEIEDQWREECEWHPWFAWFSVEVGDGLSAWLQTVERRLEYTRKPTIMAEWHIRSYIYRLPNG